MATLDWLIAAAYLRQHPRRLRRAPPTIPLEPGVGGEPAPRAAPSASGL